MPNKCAAYGCTINYDSLRKKFVDEIGQKVSTFYFPLNNSTLLPPWTTFINQADCVPSKCSVLCEKRFEEKRIKRGKVRNKLQWKLNPIPSINSVEASKRLSVLATPNEPRKLPKERFQF